MDKHLSYWQDIVDVDTFTKWHSTPMHIHKLSLLGGYVYNKKYTSVLDCGAGNGSFYKVLKGLNVDIEYKGVEITKKFVTDAQDCGIDIEYGNIEQLPFEDESYDICVAIDVLNHLRDPGPAIKEMIRVAKKHVAFTVFKPSTQELKYVWPEKGKSKIIGWYPGGPPGCLRDLRRRPHLGFYPYGTRHSRYNPFRHQTAIKEKTYKSPFGFYKHARINQEGHPILIHHHYDTQKIFDYINSIACENNEKYKISCSFTDPERRLNYLRRYLDLNDEEKNKVPHISCYTDIFYIDKAGVSDG